MHKFLMAQIKSKKNNKCWIYQVADDLAKLNINQNLEKLKLIKKSDLKFFVDKRVCV